MEGAPHIGGVGHRFALRDYYENVEISEERLWHLSDEALNAEQVRCEAKLTQAKKNMRPPRLTLWLIVGIVGVGVIGPLSAKQLGWVGYLFAITWIIGMVFVPMRKFLQTTDFERLVVKHYQDRLQLIRLIQRDRA